MVITFCVCFCRRGLLPPPSKLLGPVFFVLFKYQLGEGGELTTAFYFLTVALYMTALDPSQTSEFTCDYIVNERNLVFSFIDVLTFGSLHKFGV